MRPLMLPLRFDARRLLRLIKLNRFAPESLKVSWVWFVSQLRTRNILKIAMTHNLAFRILSPLRCRLVIFNLKTLRMRQFKTMKGDALRDELNMKLIQTRIFPVFIPVRSLSKCRTGPSLNIVRLSIEETKNAH